MGAQFALFAHLPDSAAGHKIAAANPLDDQTAAIRFGAQCSGRYGATKDKLAGFCQRRRFVVDFLGE